MKKSYIICNRKITVEAPWFTPQEGYWPMFEAEFPEADINVLCRECESLPDFGGKRLGESEAVLGIMNNIYLDFLAPREQKGCVDLLIRLAAVVPVLQLRCTPDKSAVAALENALKEYKIL